MATHKVVQAEGRHKVSATFLRMELGCLPAECKVDKRTVNYLHLLQIRAWLKAEITSQDTPALRGLGLPTIPELSLQVEDRPCA